MILTGVIKEFKPITKFTKGKAKYRRRIVTFAFKKQKLFIELRDEQIDKLAYMNIKEGDEIRVKIFFNGKANGDKYFNNILASDVKYSWEIFEEEEKLNIS